MCENDFHPPPSRNNPFDLMGIWKEKNVNELKIKLGYVFAKKK